MSASTEAYIYKASNHLDTFVTDPNGRPLKMDYIGTATLGNTTYKTIKLKYREFYGSTYADKHDYRQEWLAENFAEPLGEGRDINLASLGSNDLECRYSDTLSVRRRVVNLERSDSWWDDNFSSLSPRSILLPDGRRLYNDAAIGLIDSTYKNTGWRVPCLQDLSGMTRFYGDRGHLPPPGTRYLGVPSLLDTESLIVYGRMPMQDGQESPHPMPRPYTLLKGDPSDVRISEPSDVSGSKISCSFYSFSGQALKWTESNPVFVSGTSIIKLKQVMLFNPQTWQNQILYNFLPTRDVGTITAHRNGTAEYDVSVQCRIGIQVFLNGDLNWTSAIPAPIFGYYFRGKDFPTFYSVRLCRSPLKP